MSIGLHAGEVVSGNIGSEQRKQYWITGNVVILAARIEQLNEIYDSQLLVSAEVLKAGGDLAHECRADRPGAGQGARRADRDLPSRLAPPLESQSPH